MKARLLSQFDRLAVFARTAQMCRRAAQSAQGIERSYLLHKALSWEDRAEDVVREINQQVTSK